MSLQIAGIHRVLLKSFECLKPSRTSSSQFLRIASVSLGVFLQSAQAANVATTNNRNALFIDLGKPTASKGAQHLNQSHSSVPGWSYRKGRISLFLWWRGAAFRGSIVVTPDRTWHDLSWTPRVKTCPICTYLYLCWCYLIPFASICFFLRNWNSKLLSFQNARRIRKACAHPQRQRVKPGVSPNNDPK